ncbi:MAG: hypothetical protein HC774_03745, partial [Sphingomonadales bacterium]|nr:hypothetical protein [Sphingomonadales bacterium]
MLVLGWAGVNGENGKMVDHKSILEQRILGGVSRREVIRGMGAGAAVLATGLAFVTLALVAGIKRLLMGTFEPTVHPLWCRYVWNNEIV